MENAWFSHSSLHEYDRAGQTGSRLWGDVSDSGMCLRQVEQYIVGIRSLRGKTSRLRLGFERFSLVHFASTGRIHSAGIVSSIASGLGGVLNVNRTFADHHTARKNPAM